MAMDRIALFSCSSVNHHSSHSHGSRSSRVFMASTFRPASTIRRNFAFIQYESQEDATRALDATNSSTLMDKVISVEYAMKDDDARENGYSPEIRRDRSPDRRSRVSYFHLLSV